MQQIISPSLLLIPLIPLIGAVVSYLIGIKYRDISGWIATLAAFLSFIVAVEQVSVAGADSILFFNAFPWIVISDFEIQFALRLDSLAGVMCLIVTGIGSLIHLYSIGYMREEESKHRYFAYLNLFLFSMLLLVLGANLAVMFIGWEGVGLCSYLLIGFWYQNEAFARAGRKAFVVNRIGDAGFLLGMFLVAKTFGTLDFYGIRSAIESCHNLEAYTGVLTAISLFLFIGATGKSAQIPLYVWLPDAMAGPTPVSALIHAATMVTAGVYMCARSFAIFDNSEFTLAIVCVIGVLTALLAGLIAITQYDIKKVLAYSTVSQLGFMFVAVGTKAYWVAIFHVMTHAFFKACLFLCSGSVINACHHEQDMRKMGGLAKRMPITFLTYTISTLAIAGIAPFSGYWSKHLIIESLREVNNPFLATFSSYLPLILSFTAMLTVFYMTRSLALTFLGEYRGHHHPSESPIVMTVPLVILAGLAVVGGYFGEELYEYLKVSLPVGEVHMEVEPILTAISHSWKPIAVLLLTLILYVNYESLLKRLKDAFKSLHALSYNAFYVNELYDYVVVRPLWDGSRVLWKKVDQMVIDGCVNGVGHLTEITGEILRWVQTGQIRHYAAIMCLAFGILAYYFVLL